MSLGGALGLRGSLKTKVIRGGRLKAPLPWKLRNNLKTAYIWSWLWCSLAPTVSKFTGLLTAYGTLRAVHYRVGYSPVDYGIVSRRVVTTAFANYMTDQLQTETSTFGDFKFHDSGVGTTAAAVGDTGIETTDGESRATGTQTESASNVYRSVGTITYTTTKAITEHGLFNDATAGTLLDRHVFSALNVVNTDAIQYTYDLTLNSGG